MQFIVGTSRTSMNENERVNSLVLFLGPKAAGSVGREYEGVRNVLSCVMLHTFPGVSVLGELLLQGTRAKHITASKKAKQL